MFPALVLAAQEERRVDLKVISAELFTAAPVQVSGEHCVSSVHA